MDENLVDIIALELRKNTAINPTKSVVVARRVVSVLGAVGLYGVQQRKTMVGENRFEVISRAVAFAAMYCGEEKRDVVEEYAERNWEMYDVEALAALSVIEAAGYAVMQGWPS